MTWNSSLPDARHRLSLLCFYLPGRLFLGPEKTRAVICRERKDAVYENLRDLKLRIQGPAKCPTADYASLENFFAGRSRRGAGRDRTPGKELRTGSSENETVKGKIAVKTLPNAISQERVDCAKVELMLATEPLAERSPAGKECDVSLRVAAASMC